jgi:hypothetical protein
MNNRHGVTPWPSDHRLGGGGYVDLSGAKNSPAKPAEKVAPVPLIPPPSDILNDHKIVTSLRIRYPEDFEIVPIEECRWFKRVIPVPHRDSDWMSY